jgi:lactoylglutathione lyase
MTTEIQPFIGRTISASLTVKDLQKSLDWYQDVVGFTVDRRHEREGKLVAVSLRAGEVRLLIGQDDGARGWDRAKGEGFSLHITTDQTIDELANGIKARGGNLLSEPVDMPWGPRVFRIQDPDGFKIAISSVPAG